MPKVWPSGEFSGGPASKLDVQTSGEVATNLRARYPLSDAIEAIGLHEMAEELARL